MDTWSGSSRWKHDEHMALVYAIKVIVTFTLALIVWTAFTVPQFLAFIGA